MFTSRPPPAVLQNSNLVLSRPPPAGIMSLLKRLRPITVKVLKPTAVSKTRHPQNSGLSYNEQQFLSCMESTAPGPDTFDRNDLLRQFDQLQSNKSAKIDILAQAMELSSIPSESINNLDLVGQAMEMSDIQSDMMMNF